MFDGADPGKKTPAQIATAVHRSARLQSAESELARLKAQRAAIREKMLSLIALGTDGYTDEAIVQLEAEDRAAVDKLGPLRRTTLALRREHGERVRAALAVAITETAQRAHAAAVALAAALAEIDRINDALARSHSAEIWVPRPDLSLTVERTARLAGRT